MTLGEPAPDVERERFDTVVCANVLEHVEDDDAALRQIFALLEPGGRVVLVVPMLRALYGRSIARSTTTAATSAPRSRRSSRRRASRSRRRRR